MHRHGIIRSRAWRRGCAVLALLLSAGPASAAQRSSYTVIEPEHVPLNPSSRNVLLIIGDDIGVDQIAEYVDYYNATTRTDDDMPVTPPATPAISRLADAGVVFLNAWSSPSCSATRAGVVTGTYSVRHGIYSPLGPSDDGLDPSTTTTIAETLSGVGIEAGLFGKWHLGSSHLPDDHGWSMFAGSVDGQLSPSYFEWDRTVVRVMELAAPLPPFLGTPEITLEWSGTTDPADPDDYATFMNADDAVSWISGRSGPWMATVAFNAAHWVDSDPTSGVTQTLVGQAPPNTRGCSGTTGSADEDLIYGEIIECMDTQIDSLLTELETLGELADTTVIFIGDNGTEMDRTDHLPFQTHAKGSVYEGGVNVPFIIADGHALHESGVSGTGTGRVVSPGRVSTALVQTVDLFATIAAIGGADASTGIDSVSLVPLLERSASAVRSYSFTETEHDVAVRGSLFKLIVRNVDSAAPVCELYDLSLDRWEQDDLLDGTPTTKATNRRDALLPQITTLSGRSLFPGSSIES